MSTTNYEILLAEEEIALTRENLARSMQALEVEIARAVDWREWVRRKPLLVVGIALGAGILLGLRKRNCP